uniref:Protein SirB1 N-terminal domain-containing protein n=1 Tax=Anguilla anguilla TaxID=7936 RepID=A0A0E9RAI2_ANGAN
MSTVKANTPEKCFGLLTPFAFLPVLIRCCSAGRAFPISLSVLYLTLARKLGVQLEPVNFPSRFLLRWCQQRRG